MLEQVAEQRGHPLDVHDVVDHGGRQGLRHGGITRGARVLDDDGAPRLLDVHRTRRAVRPRPGEDHGHEAIPIGPGRGPQQEVHRRTRAVVLIRTFDGHRAVVHDDVPIGGHDVHRPRPHLLALRDEDDGHLRLPLQHGLQVALMVRIQVLGQDHGSGEARRKPAEQRAQGFDAAGGRAHHHEVFELRLRLVRRNRAFARHAENSVASTSFSMVRQRGDMVVQAEEIRLTRRHRRVAAVRRLGDGRRAS